RTDGKRVSEFREENSFGAKMIGPGLQYSGTMLVKNNRERPTQVRNESVALSLIKRGQIRCNINARRGAEQVSVADKRQLRIVKKARLHRAIVRDRHENVAAPILPVVRAMFVDGG